MCAALCSVAWACSSTNGGQGKLVGIDAQSLCDKAINTCGVTTDGTMDQCVAAFSALRVSQTCADDIKSASCEDLGSDKSTVTNTCFPSCNDPATFVCNLDNTLTECVNGGPDGGSRSLTEDCAAACKANGLTYTGTCSDTYSGQSAEHPQCWCK